MMNEIDTIARAVATLRKRFGGEFPKTALMLGSGLGAFAGRLNDAETIPYGDIPGFPGSTVEGHAGKLTLGAVGGTFLAAMQGRFHAYEGYCGLEIARPIRILKSLGVERLILTNAAGGLREDMKAGTLVVLKDHINFSGFNPLVGANLDAFGPRFPDMTAAYDPGLRTAMLEAALEAGVSVKSGVYLFALGPNFETPAEVRLFAKLGADVVGMSTVPECLAARHCGMKVVALSVVTNLAAGLSNVPPSHGETLAEAKNACGRVERLLLKFLTKRK
jgi:inosine/guanosine/xanthosine phosphorylase family protein